jgi:RecB family endonuclease NucS
VPREELENILDDIELTRLEALKKLGNSTLNTVIEIVPNLERLLEDFLEKNLEHIETGLKLYKDEKGILGRQYSTGIGIIDLLCIDKDKKFVVLEIKKEKGSDITVGQITRYMGWVKENLANNKEVRGIIIVHEVDEKLEYSASMLSNVEIKYYKIILKFVPKEELGQS